MDLALNNLQWLICRETKPNQTKPSSTGGTMTAGQFTFPRLVAFPRGINAECIRFELWSTIPLSAKKKGIDVCHKSNLKNTVGTIIVIPGLNMTGQLI